jgi:TRAP-type mannitol/chloroaromatic compound transport system permease small subunit
MERVLSFLEGINEWIGRIFSWTVALLTLIVVLEVVLRYVFNSPTVCNFEITTQLYGFYFMIVAGYALLHNAHVSVDIIVVRLPERKKAIIDLLSYVLFFFPFCGIVLVYGTYFALDSWEMLETSWSACGLPLYPVKTIIPISFLLITIQGTVSFIRTIARLLRGGQDD